MTVAAKAGRYELLDELGRGAMGVVYRAHDPVIGRSVAVKTMRLSEEGTGMSHAELLSRFQTEARAAGLLAHPNIVTVYDAGEEEGLFYITMELVEGRSLQALLDASQTFPLSRVLRIMEQACSALDFAHQRNVVHRDIKPANLMITPDDTVKVTDFGTAKILQIGTAQTQHVIGTPSYMSPEQVKGQRVDGRSDIFSLGVILYELVTGEKPFPGENLTTVIYKIVNEEPIPPRELDSSVHPGLSYVITHALAKQPAERYQSCREFLEALSNYREQGASDLTVVMPAAGGSAARSDLSTPTSAGAAAGADRSSAQASPAPHASMAPPDAFGTLAEPQPQKKRGRFLLALLLIVLIAIVGKQDWPLLQEVWQRVQAERAAQKAPPAVTAVPASNAVQPPAAAGPGGAAATPETSKETPAPEEKTAQPNGSHEGTPEPRPASPPVSAQPVSPAPKSSGPHVSVPHASKPSQPTAEERELQLRIEQRLARANLAGKVLPQVSGNNVTLSGKLLPREHRRLLWQLRDVPDTVRVIDHIEYADPPLGEQAAPAEERPADTEAGRGMVFLTSDPAGAEVLVDGFPAGRRTPTRLPLRAGEHTLTFLMRGRAPARRTIVVEEDRAMQISISLR